MIISSHSFKMNSLRLLYLVVFTCSLFGISYQATAATEKYLSSTDFKVYVKSDNGESITLSNNGINTVTCELTNKQNYAVSFFIFFYKDESCINNTGNATVIPFSYNGTLTHRATSNNIPLSPNNCWVNGINAMQIDVPSAQNNSSTNVNLTFSFSNNQITINDGTSLNVPKISISNCENIELTGDEGSLGSNHTSFYVSGEMLTEKITISAPEGFLISKTENGTYSQTIFLNQTSGNVSSTQIYVRTSNTANHGIYDNKQITATSIDEEKSCLVSGTINQPAPKISFSQSNVTTSNAEWGEAGASSEITISGSHLSHTVNIYFENNSQTDFEIRTANSNWGQSINDLESNNGFLNSPIYIRLKASTNSQTKTQKLKASSNGEELTICSLSGTVNQQQGDSKINDISDITNFNGISYSGNTTGYIYGIANCAGANAGDQVYSEFKIDFSNIYIGNANYENSNYFFDNPQYGFLYNSNTPFEPNVIKLSGRQGLKYKIKYTTASANNGTLNYTIEPYISYSCPENMTAFINNVSPSSTFNVSGTGLDENLTITAPDHFQISPDNINWSSILTIQKTNDYILNTTIYIRMTASPTAITARGNLTFSTSNVSNSTCSVEGTIYGIELSNITGPSSICEGDPFSLISSVSLEGGETASYQWYLNGNRIDGATNNVYSVNQASQQDLGVYTLKATYNGNVYQTEEHSLNYTSTPATPNITPANPNLCTGTSQIFSIATYSGETYEWYLNNEKTSSTGNNYSLSIGDNTNVTYKIKVIAKNACSSQSVETADLLPANCTKCSSQDISTINFNGTLPSNINVFSSEGISLKDECSYNGGFIDGNSWKYSYSIYDGTTTDSKYNMIPKTSKNPDGGGILLFCFAKTSAEKNLFKIQTSKNIVPTDNYLITFKAENYSLYTSTVTIKTNCSSLGEKTVATIIRGSNFSESEIPSSANTNNIYWKTYSNIIVTGQDIIDGIIFKGDINREDGGIAFDDIKISQVCPPDVYISISGNLCNADEATLNANISEMNGTYTYVWKRNDEIISGATSQTYTTAESGEYRYSVEVTDENGLRGSANYTVKCREVRLSCPSGIFSTLEGVPSESKKVNISGSNLGSRSKLYLIAPQYFQVSQDNINFYNQAYFTSDEFGNIEAAELYVRLIGGAPTNEGLFSGKIAARLGSATGDLISESCELLGEESSITATCPISLLSTVEGTASTSITTTIEGINLNKEVIVTVPDGFEIKDANGIYGKSTILPLSNRTLRHTELEIRLSASAIASISYSNKEIEIRSGDIYLTCSISGSVTLPSLTTECELTAFSVNLGDICESKQINISGENLYKDIYVIAPNGFSVSSDNIGWGRSAILQPTNNLLNRSIIYIRMESITSGSFDGQLSFTLGENGSFIQTTNNNCEIDGTVNPILNIMGNKEEISCETTVSLSAIPMGLSDEISFSWSNSSDEILSTSSVLTINPIRESQTYTITVSGKMDDGTSLPTPLTKTVTIPGCKTAIYPTITASPSSSIFEGNAVTLTASIQQNVDLSDAIFVWKKKIGDNWQDINAANTNTYSFVASYEYQDNERNSNSDFTQYKVEISKDGVITSTSPAISISEKNSNNGHDCASATEALHLSAFDIATNANKFDNFNASDCNENVFILIANNDQQTIGNINFFEGCCFNQIEVKYSTESAGSLKFYYLTDNASKNYFAEINTEAGSNCQFSDVTETFNCFINGEKTIYIESSSSVKIQYVEFTKRTDGMCPSIKFSDIATESNPFCVGGSLNLSVIATETNVSKDEITYQWYKDNNKVEHATSTTYSIAQTSVGDIGTYTIKAFICGNLVDSKSIEIRSTFESLSLEGFGYTVGSTICPIKSFTTHVPACMGRATVSVEGKSYLISSAEDGNYSSSLLNISDGTTIYVRLKKGLSEGSYSEAINVTYENYSSQKVLLAGTILLPNVEITVSDKNGGRCVIGGTSTLNAKINNGKIKDDLLYEWILNNTIVGNSSQLSLSNTSEEGTYTLRVTFNEEGSNIIETASYEANCFEVNVSSPYFCEGDVINLNWDQSIGQQNGYEIISVNLMEGDNLIASIDNTQTSYQINSNSTTAGTYHISMTARNTTNTTFYISSKEFSIQKKQLCDKTAQITGNSAYCGDPITLTASIKEGGQDQIVNLVCTGKKNTTFATENTIYQYLIRNVSENIATGNYYAQFSVSGLPEGTIDATPWSAPFEIKSVPTCSNAAITIQTKNIVLCEGENATIKGSISGINPYKSADLTYSWIITDSNNTLLTASEEIKFTEQNTTPETIVYSSLSKDDISISIPFSSLGTNNNVSVYLQVKEGDKQILKSNTINIKKGIVCDRPTFINKSIIVCDGNDVGSLVLNLENEFNPNISYSYVLYRGRVEGNTYIDLGNSTEKAIANTNGNTFNINIGNPEYEKTFYYVKLIAKDGLREDFVTSDTLIVHRIVELKYSPTISVAACSDRYNDLAATISFNSEYTTEGSQFKYEWYAPNNTKISEGTKTIDATDLKSKNFTLGLNNQIITEGGTYKLSINGGCMTTETNFVATVDDCQLFTHPDTVYYCDGTTFKSDNGGLNIEYKGNFPSNLITISWTCGATTKTGWDVTFDGLSGIKTISITATLSNTGQVIYRGNVTALPGSECTIDYFVDKEKAGDGSSWENAYKTLNQALASAYNAHLTEETKDKKINIYMAAGDGYTVSNDNENYKNLCYTTIHGGFVDKEGCSTNNATGQTTIGRSNPGSSCFTIGKGDITLSRLIFSGLQGNNGRCGERIITTLGSNAEATESNYEESLTIRNCEFTNNNGIKGCIKLNAENGGKLNIYNCNFSNNTPCSNIDNYGLALNIFGPYDIKISTDEPDNNLPKTYIDQNEIPTQNNCNDKKYLNLTLLDTTDQNLSKNKFEDNVYNAGKENGKGAVIYIDSARSISIDYALFKENALYDGFGGIVYISNTNYAKISHSYFVKNKHTNSSENKNLGGALHFLNVPTAIVNYCAFLGNTIPQGNGSSLSGDNSSVDLRNTQFIGNKVTGSGNGGAFYVCNSTLINIYYSKFKNNIMDNGSGIGGGAYVRGAVVNVNNSWFEKNAAGQAGGGFYAGGNNNKSYDPKTLISIDRSVFFENAVFNGTGNGGSIYAENMDLVLQRSYFYRNTVAEGGSDNDARASAAINNGYAKIFSTTFYDNRPATQNQAAGALGISNHPNSASNEPNAYIYNCTFTENGAGNNYGAIAIVNGAYADIVSCTIAENNGSKFSVANKNEISESSETNNNTCALYVSTNSKINLANSILSGNTSSNWNLNGIADSRLQLFSRNTLNESIYGDSKNDIISQTNISVYSCDPNVQTSSSNSCSQSATCLLSAFNRSQLLPLCEYGAPTAPTKPYNLQDNDYCHNHGVTIEWLKNYHIDDPTLSSELILDEHRSLRGWRYLCTECDQTAEDIKNDFRTFQGAVEGGIGVYEGKKFDLEVSRMVGLCSGGELSPAYIDINILQSGSNATILSNELKKYYWIKIERIYNDNNGKLDTVSYYTDSLITRIDVYKEDTCIHLENTPPGTYIIHVGRIGDDDKLQERHTSAIKVENIGFTSMTWIGENDNDFNNQNNWRYSDENGNIADYNTIPTTPPSSCYDIHIGLAKPGKNGASKDVNVSYLPSIFGDKGECADIYFHPDGSLGQIQKLTYNKAHIEMRVDAYSKESSPDTKWKMISAPLKEMVSGDYLYSNRSVYIRYFNIQKNDNTYAGTWTTSVANVGESLSKLGMGYAYRYFTKNPYYYLKDTITYSFPKEDLSYSYYNGRTEKVRTSTSFRFLPESEGTNRIPDITEVKINLIERGFNIADNQMGFNDETKAKGYIIIGNPFMSHIDLNAFYAANQNNIESDFKQYSGCKFNSYAMTDKNNFNSWISTSEKQGDVYNEAYNRYIPPMQAFFVKPKNIASDGTITLKFPATTISCAVTPVDYGSTLRKFTVTKNKLCIRACYENFRSNMTIIATKERANNGFSENEDSQKLLYSGSIIDVYTKSGNNSLDINILDKDSLNGVLIPVSVSVYKAGMVSISVSGAEGFEDASNVYWVDKQTGCKTSLNKQSSFEYNLDKGTTENRFFICFDQKERVKINIKDTVCLSETYAYGAGFITANCVGDISKRELVESSLYIGPDTVYYVDLNVNSTYLIHVNDSIYEGEIYNKNGFYINTDSVIGIINDTLRLNSQTGCDSIIYLSLNIKKSLYDAIAYYGNTTPVHIQVDSTGSGLKLQHNALAYFNEDIPASLRNLTNVIHSNNGIYEAVKVELADSADLYIPHGFNADSIIYTRKPSIYADRTHGWETIVLPFTVTEFYNSGSNVDTGLVACKLTPFNKSDNMVYGDFWLKKFVTSKSDALGFDYPDKPILEANLPYIVAYPNDTWGDAYSLSGQTIRYVSTMTKVHATPNPIRTETDHFYIYGTTVHADVNNSYTLKSYENIFGYNERSTIVLPFRAFVIEKRQSSHPLRSLFLYDENNDDENYSALGSIEANGPSIFIVYEREGHLCIYSSEAGETDIYDVNARTFIQKARYMKGETILQKLPAGVYIVKRNRIIIE